MVTTTKKRKVVAEVTNTNRIPQAQEALMGELVKYMPAMERRVLMASLHGEEAPSIAETVLSVLHTIETMPVSYEQDGKGDDAVVHLHYFGPSSDHWITEKDMEGGVDQAFGFACLNGDTQSAEMGYISIAELVQNGAELDLYWSPKTLAEVKAKL